MHMLGWESLFQRWLGEPNEHLHKTGVYFALNMCQELDWRNSNRQPGNCRTIRSDVGALGVGHLPQSLPDTKWPPTHLTLAWRQCYGGRGEEGRRGEEKERGQTKHWPQRVNQMIKEIKPTCMIQLVYHRIQVDNCASCGLLPRGSRSKAWDKIIVWGRGWF